MSSVVIRCRADGPLVVEGDFTLLDDRGQPIEPPGDKPNVALCRCGASAKKPFCDGSHRRVGFRDGHSGQ